MKQVAKSISAIERRKRAVTRLESQLKSGVKIQKQTTDVVVPLTDKDKVRIEKELNTLKSRI